MLRTNGLTKVALTGFFSLIALLAIADPTKITIEFSGEGDHVVYFQKKEQLQQVPDDANHVTGKSVDLNTSLDPATDGKDMVIVIVDNSRGDAVLKPLDYAVKTKTVKVADADYNLVAQSLFSIHGPGGLLAAGTVHIEGPDGKFDYPLSPSDKGIVTYRLHPAGDLKVSVDYRSKGESKSLPAQTFESKLESGKPSDTAINISDPVDLVPTVSATPTTAGAPKSLSGDNIKVGKTDTGDDTSDAADQAAAKSKQAAGGLSQVIGSFLNLLFGLVILGGLGWGIWWYTKNNRSQVQTVLSQAGVPMGTDPTQPADMNAVQQPPAQPQPMQKIVLDPNTSIPTPHAPMDPLASSTGPGITMGAGTGMAFSIPGAVKNPRLVSDDGMMFLLNDGVSEVGREPGLPISLTGETSVSRSHALVTVTDGVASVTDKGSTNGTFINGMKVAAPVTLQAGDTVQFGAIRLKYEE